MNSMSKDTSRRGFVKAGVLAGLAGATLLLLGSSNSSAQATPDQGVRALPGDSLQAIIDKHAENGVPGLVLRVETRDGASWTGAAGVKRQGGEAMSPQTHFPVFSIAKMAMAAAALSLTEDGVWSLEDPISRWLDPVIVNAIPNAAQIMVRDLVLQTSGVRDYFDESFVAKLWADPGRHWQPEELVALGLKGEPAGTPRDGDSDYSNTNYVLLGLAMQKATGSPLAAVLRQRVFKPLGMTETASWEENRIKIETAGYIPAGGEMIEVDGIDLSMAWGGGGLISTAKDAAALTNGILVGGVLSDASRQEVLSTFHPMKGKTITYGYSVIRMEIGGSMLIGTTGEAAGYATATFFDPATKTTIAVLTNVFSEDWMHTIAEVIQVLKD